MVARSVHGRFAPLRLPAGARVAGGRDVRARQPRPAGRRVRSRRGVDRTYIVSIPSCLQCKSSSIVPRWLAILGIAGYAALLLGAAGTALASTDIHSGAGVLFLGPGGLFELLFPLLLIFKGLEHASPDLDPAKPRPAAEVPA